jgi:hypothetical protein
MVVFSPGLKWGLFCHEHVLVEKLDNASRIHLSWSRAEEKLQHIGHREHRVRKSDFSVLSESSVLKGFEVSPTAK